MEVDPQTVKYGFDAVRAAVETIKALRDAFKSGGKSSANLDDQIRAAEKQVSFAEAQLAQSLNYKLCRAHFPPVPMLRHRFDVNRGTEISRCPVCGLEDPSAEEFASIDRFNSTIVHDPGHGLW